MDAVLVTGGAGFIGSHVCRALDRSGYLPITIDDLSTGKREFVKWGPLIEARIDDLAALDAARGTWHIKGCIHLAGSIEVGRSMREPIAFWCNNVVASLALIERLTAEALGAFVFSSSAAVYGAPDSTPIAETHPLRPANPYGETKLAIERVLAAVAAAGGPPWLALRYFNAAGSAFADGIGEAHDPETHLVPLACLAALGRAPVLSVMGDNYDTPDGTAIRDYVHVEDLADAHVAALRAGFEGRAGAYNLGTGRGYSVLEVIQTVSQIAGRAVPYRIGPRRAGDVARLVADPTAAARDLGWRAQRSELPVIAADAWQWHSRETK
jgi:UDP-arabinose 4-epimerase